jgi:16S rRNA (guanine527-N7)-methyltransferase
MGDEASAVIRPYAKYIVRPTEDIASDLEAYVELLKRWQRVQNLVSRETLPSLWTRHIADSLQVLRLLSDSDRRFVDLGSGGGLPAIPLVIAWRDVPGASFNLVEPNARKAAFLRTVARELKLPVIVHACRAQEIDSRETLRPDVITSRALAPLTDLLALAAPCTTPKTRAIFHKGSEYAEEIAESRAHWLFDVLVVPSDTDPASALLEIRHLLGKSVG